MSTAPEDDPGLDMLSDCFVEKSVMQDGKPVKILVELTWREVGEYCRKEMKLYDSLGNAMRLKNQVANDPNYKPIEPMAGLKKWKRWRG
jgi:hypothetical protein